MATGRLARRGRRGLPACLPAACLTEGLPEWPAARAPPHGPHWPAPPLRGLAMADDDARAVLEAAAAASCGGGRGGGAARAAAEGRPPKDAGRAARLCIHRDRPGDGERRGKREKNKAKKKQNLKKKIQPPKTFSKRGRNTSSQPRIRVRSPPAPQKGSAPRTSPRCPPLCAAEISGSPSPQVPRGWGRCPKPPKVPFPPCSAPTDGDARRLGLKRRGCGIPVEAAGAKFALPEAGTSWGRGRL